MKLTKLTSENIGKVEGHRILCYEKYPGYMRELLERFPGTAPIIECVYDDNRRNAGSFSIGAKLFEVKPTNLLSEENLKDTILLITSDYYKEAYERLIEIDHVRNSIGEIYYFLTRESDIEENYIAKYKEDGLRNLIIFRSGPHPSSYVYGMDYGDNAKALFEYMLSAGINKKYEIVWIVKNPGEERYKPVCEENENVRFLSYELTDEYYDALFHAKYIFFTDAYGFARNCYPNQIRVQLWHGYALKSRAFFVRCEKRYEYLTVVSRMFGDIHRKLFGLRDDQILVTGYPKGDLLFRPQEEWRGLLHIPYAKRYIFWAPTFRASDKALPELNEKKPDGETGLPVVRRSIDMEHLNTLLVQNDTVMILRLHPFQNRDEIHVEGYSNIRLLDNDAMINKNIQINEILAYADAMISDYSSIVMEYLVLDRPIAITVDDIEEFKTGRGFVVDNPEEWFPGVQVKEFRELENFVESVINGNDLYCEKRREIRGRVHDFYDNESSRRVVDALGIDRLEDQ